MANISSVFKSALLNKYSSIQDTSVDYGNTNITANYSVEDIDLSLTSSTSDNTSIFDTNIADLTSGKETFVKLHDLSTKELENIDSIMNQASDLINRYKGLSFQSKGGYGTTMQAAQGELRQVEVDLDNFIKANSTYSSYQELLDTQKQIGDIDKYCEEMIVYYDRQIKWQDYYKIYDSEECQKSSIEGMLGEKEYTYNNYTSRSEEYTKLLEIQTIGNYDEKLKELFGDDYQEQFASYGLDFQFDYLKMYNYLYQTQGEAAAKEFYAFAEDNINSMDGLYHALSAINQLTTDAEIMEAITNYLTVHAQGMGAGVVGSLEGVVAWFSDNRSRSATSYETMWYSMMLETEKFGKGQVFNYQVGQGTGQMLPVMLIGCVCPESLMIGGMPVVKVATSGYLLMSSGGRDYKEQMINGKTREEAIIHGLLAGTTEVTTEHLLGGLPFLSETNVYNLRTYFTAMGKEGFQEVIQDMISEFLLGDGIPNFNSEAERDAYWDQWSKEKLMTFAVAAFSAGELQGGSLAMSKINLRNINTQIDKGIVTEQELVDLIKEQYPTETMDLSNKEIIGEYNGQIAKYIELKLEALLKMSPETSTDNTPIEEKVDTDQIESSYDTKKTSFQFRVKQDGINFNDLFTGKLPFSDGDGVTVITSDCLISRLNSDADSMGNHIGNIAEILSNVVGVEKTPRELSTKIDSNSGGQYGILIRYVPDDEFAQIILALPDNIDEGMISGLRELKKQWESVELSDDFKPFLLVCDENFNQIYGLDDEGFDISHIDDLIEYLEYKKDNRLDELEQIKQEQKMLTSPIAHHIESSAEINSSIILEKYINSELDVLDLNKFEKIIKDVQEITIDKLPDGYTSVEQYKKDFTNQLLLKHGNLMKNIHTYYLAKDPIMFHELLENSEKIEKLFINNYQSDSLNTIYEKAQSSDIVSLWNKPKMVELIKSVTAKDFGIIMNNLNESVGGNYNTLDVFVNKICSLNYEQLQEFSKNYKYSNEILFGEKQFKLNMNNTMRVYDHLLNNIYTYNNRIYVPMDRIKGTIIPYFSSYNIDETFSIKLNSILEKKQSLENILIEEMKSSISKEVEIKDHYFITPKDRKYWNITYVMNGKEYTVTKTAFNREIDFINSSFDGFYNLEIGKALSNNQLFIKNIEENIRKNSLVLDKSTGIQEGINYITIEEDGVERRIIKNISSFSSSLDLNYEVSEQAKQINIKEIIPLGNQDIQLSNYTLDDIYKVSYKIGEELATFYITPTRNKFRNTVNLQINDFIIKHNLFGAKDFKIEKVSDLETTIDYIHQLSGTSLLLQQDQYGGDQGDVPNFIKNYYKKSNNAIENQKAKTMIDIIKSYYPNATQMDIINIAESYAPNGCVYMAFANTFVAHMGSIENGADIFKRKIGYDLIVTDGTNKSYNVEALALNINLNRCKKMNLSMEETIKNNDGVSYQSTPTDIVSFFEDRGIKIKEQRGIKFEPKENSIMTSLLAEIASNPNNMYILRAKGFDLESFSSQSAFDNNDKALESSVVDKNVRKNVGGHGMLITGLTESGDFIVSSWKEKFIFKVGEMLKNDGYAYIDSVRYEE